jgi:predicted PhzF superfamily epimerase YddE/YHI9
VPRLHVLRVFCGEDGAGGNPLGVFLDGGEIPPADRQAVAADLGFSETVFVEDREQGAVRIHTPSVELPFAGHPVVGTGWLLAHEGSAISSLHTLAGDVPVRSEGDMAWASGRPEWVFEIEFARVDSPDRVERLTGPPEGEECIGIWAWLDETAGVIRERVFVPEYGVAEDEATGAAAVALCAQLGRPIEIHQGRGSVILARPLADGMVEIGGRVVLDEERDYALPE